jgi:hypothetical protein
MTDEPSSLSQRAEARASAKARRAKRIGRREAFLDLVVSGYSHRQIATAMGVSLATVRRKVDKALAERPLHAPERYASLQVERLTRALCHADFKLAHGDIRAFAPDLKIVAALDRYHGLDGRLSLPRAALIGNALAARPDETETRRSPSPTPSLTSCRSRRKLHDSAPKILKSLARLSTSSGGSGEPETRRHAMSVLRALAWEPTSACGAPLWMKMVAARAAT